MAALAGGASRAYGYPGVECLVGPISVAKVPFIRRCLRSSIPEDAMRLKIPICIVDHHRPDRDAISWDGTSYLGTCWLCKKPIRRDSKGRWRGTELHAR